MLQYCAAIRKIIEQDLIVRSLVRYILLSEYDLCFELIIALFDVISCFIRASQNGTKSYFYCVNDN